MACSDGVSCTVDGDGPWVVRVQTVDREVIRALAQWADVWSVYPRKGYTLVSPPVYPPRR